MTETFPRLDILAPPQRALWPDLADVPEEFVLYGGTAIALHLGHRGSADFNFSADAPTDPDRLLENLPFLRGGAILQCRPNTLVVTVDRGGPVKVYFFGVPNVKRLKDPKIADDNGLKIASLLDLAGRKALVVQVRAELRDYTDIDALITAGISLPDALSAGRGIYGANFDPQATLKALSLFSDGNLAGLDLATRSRLVEAVRQVDLRKLPELDLGEG